MSRESYEELARHLMGHLDPAAAKAFRRGYEGATRAEESKPLPQIRGRREGDVLWVRAEDVADALEAQAPAANARLIEKLRG